MFKPMSSEKMRLSRKINRKVHLRQSIPHSRFFLVKDYIRKFCYNNDYSTTAKTYLRHVIFYDCSEIAIDNAKN